MGSTLLMRNGSMMVLVSMARPSLVMTILSFVTQIRRIRRAGQCRLEDFALPHRVVGQLVGLAVVFALNVLDGEVNRSRQFAAGPVQGMQARAAAGVFAGHLLDHHFGVRINMQRLGVDRDGVLQGLEQGDVFCYVIVLMPDPAGDANGFAVGTFNYDSNPGWSGISVRAAVHVGYEIGHSTPTYIQCFSASDWSRANSGSSRLSLDATVL